MKLLTATYCFIKAIDCIFYRFTCIIKREKAPLLHDLLMTLLDEWVSVCFLSRHCITACSYCTCYYLEYCSSLPGVSVNHVSSNWPQVVRVYLSATWWWISHRGYQVMWLMFPWFNSSPFVIIFSTILIGHLKESRPILLHSQLQGQISPMAGN